MSVYKFRILSEDKTNQDVFRDIEIKSSQTFYDLHEIIVASFGFDNSQMASFYISDENWNKGKEITLFDMGLKDNEDEILVMEKTSINNKITCVGSHLLYCYDFLNMKNFFIELIESKVKEDEKSFYPKVVYSQGELPKENPDNNLLTEEDIANQMLKDAGFDVDGEESDDDIFDGFDDFENYQ